MSTEAKVTGQKGRKPSTKPNAVFTGVMRRAANGQAVITVQFNDSEGTRHKQEKTLVVVNNELQLADFEDTPAAGEAVAETEETEEAVEETEAAPVA